MGKKLGGKIEYKDQKLRTKKVLFWAKILINIEFKGQKLTNFQKKERKKGHFWPKKEAGAELKKKKKDFWAKNWEKN